MRVSQLGVCEKKRAKIPKLPLNTRRDLVLSLEQTNEMTLSPLLSPFPRLWKLTTSVVRWGDMCCAWRRMESFREKLLQLAKKTKRFFFRSTAFYPTRDEVDVSSEFSRGSRIVLNTSADRFVLSRTFFETNRFCFVALKKTWILRKESRLRLPTHRKIYARYHATTAHALISPDSDHHDLLEDVREWTW